MSQLRDVADHSARICVAALALSGGVAVGVVSLTVLATMGAQYWKGQRATCRETAARAAVTALQAVPEFRTAEWDRVLALLSDAHGSVGLDVGRIGAAARAGAAGFRGVLFDGLARTVPEEPGDTLNRRLALLALEAALDCLIADTTALAGVEHVVLLDLARDMGVTLTLLDRIDAQGARTEGKVDALAEQVAAQNPMLMEILAKLDRIEEARESGITDAALIGLARRIAAEVPDAQAAFRELENAVEVAIRVQAQGAVGSNHGDFVDRVLAEVARLAREGAYDAAADEIDAALAREEAESKARTLRLLESGIEQDILRRNAAGVAARLLRKAEVEGKAERADLNALQTEWYERGRDKGLNLDLEVAIALAESMVARSRGPDQRGSALNNLGNALYTLGQREAGTARLEEAVEAYRVALGELTRDRVPLDWAMTQNNLGSALQTLGAREAGTARLEEAVEAYRAALEVRTRDRVPLDWAGTQNNLGTALQTLGAREGDTARLEEAVEAYRAALQELTRDRVPLEWAGLQDNLGTALLTLGTREAGTARLEEAVIAYRAALQERTRDRVPLDWAVTQFNLGVVELTFFTETLGPIHLDQAEELALAATEVFREAGATYILSFADQILAEIARLRANPPGAPLP